MSVVKGKRSVSGMEFLKTARDIEEMFIDLRIHKPKRYSFFFDKLLNISMDMTTAVKSGNSMYPQNLEEAQTRIDYFKQGICLCQALVSQLEIIQHKLKDEGISAGDMVLLSDKLTNEIKLLKGLCNADRKRYRNLPATLADEIIQEVMKKYKAEYGDTNDISIFNNVVEDFPEESEEPAQPQEPKQIKFYSQSSH